MREGSAKKETEQSAMASSQGPPTGTRSWERHHDVPPTASRGNSGQYLDFSLVKLISDI